MVTELLNCLLDGMSPEQVAEQCGLSLYDVKAVCGSPLVGLWQRIESVNKQEQE